MPPPNRSNSPGKPMHATRRPTPARAVTRRVAGLLIALAATLPARGQEPVRVGPAAGYATALPPGAKGPQAEIYRAENLRGPTPTNDWWSSLAWMKFSERMYAHPLALQA